MRSKLLCAVSLLLNVALAGYWLKSRVAGPGPVPVVAETPSAPFGPKPPPLRRSPAVPSSVLPRQGAEPSPWARIESDDFPTFIANLRATGCPERTLRDIVVPEVDALFKVREEAVPEEEEFWLPTAMVEERSRARRIAQWNVELERRELLRRLLGVEGCWPRDVERDPDEMAGFSALLTPPTFEAAEQVLWVMDRTEFEKDGISAHAGHPLKFAEIDALRDLRDRAFARVVEIVGSARIGELLGVVGVAMVTLKELESFEDKDPALRFSESEIRRLVAAQPRDLTFVDEAFGFDEVTRLERFRAGLPEKGSGEQKAAFLETVASVLGNERSRLFQTRLATGWDEAAGFVEEAQLPRPTAEMLVDVRALADAEARRIRQDPTLSAEEELEGLRRIAEDVQTAIGAGLPAQALETYLAEHARWIEALQSGQEEDE